MSIQVNLNIGSARYMPDGPFRQAEARRSIKLFHVPRDVESAVLDSMIPECLVSDSMVARYLDVRPPQFRVTAVFDTIIEEIERAFVLGQYFSALAASVVTIERMLNDARMRLHEHSSPKLKQLWEKGPLNDWRENIKALHQWGYLHEELASELTVAYEIRCRYLHSGLIDSLQDDARRCVVAAFALLTEFIGFPDRLFRIGSTIECLNTSDPLFQVFYKPALSSDHAHESAIEREGEP
jgi:hypothetical protein